MPGITRVNLLYNMPPQPERPARDGKPARPAKPARPGRLAVAKSAFYDNFVWHSDEDLYVPGTDVPRLKLLHLASNATAAFNDEIDALVEGLRRWRDRSHPKPSAQPTPVSKIRKKRADTPAPTVALVPMPNSPAPAAVTAGKAADSNDTDAASNAKAPVQQRGNARGDLDDEIPF